MGKSWPAINDDIASFIMAQPLFFVATAAAGRHINLSPKGLYGVRVISEQRVIWMNLTGSGNETAAHLLEDGRMTLMFCAFSDAPKIIRLYGHARAVEMWDDDWSSLSAHFPDDPGRRQVVDMQVDRVQQSCGFGVPTFDTATQRQQLTEFATKRGVDGIQAYRRKNNTVSIDGVSLRVE